MIVPEIVVELIGFIHKVLAFAYTKISAKAWNDCTNLARWIKARLNKHECKHCRCCSFTMDPTDRKHKLALHPFAHQLLPCHDRHSTCLCSDQFRIIRIESHNCRYIN